MIGLIIVQNGTERRYSFWADGQNHEEEIFSQLLDILKDYSEFKLYHYGSYETKFLHKMQKGINLENAVVFNKIIKNSVNILSIIYSHIFFPVYSNGLKDIGTFLGFKWSSEDASGIQSLLWRKQFEMDHNETIKGKLIEYNLEDCLALKRIVEFISEISLNDEKEANKDSDIVYTDDLKDDSRCKWGEADFTLKDFDYINKCAYFDYQREKVFFRTNKNLRKAKRHRGFQEKRSYKINKRIISPIHRECPYCKGKLYRNGESQLRKIYDLRFSDSGIKNWITAYESIRMRCVPCRKVITFESFKGVSKYGHGLISWVIYQNVTCYQPLYRIRYMIDELFGLSASRTTIQKFKSFAAEYYQETYQEIIQKIKRGNLIHVDETPVAFLELKGYVWVFTNMEEVYFLYTPTREGDFLKELLSSFKGVLISDFYGAYCSSEWIQQKCLIHLIRDLNDDLLTSPFDEEYKKMVTDFSVLLRQIIATVDEHGLKKRKLSKHKKEVFRYFQNVFRCNYQSELAKKYQKRFQKNENTLFTFLDYDGIPWNNNNAEHAIKIFCDYRRIMRKGGFFTERGFTDYLVLLSIFQTCRYKGVN